MIGHNGREAFDYNELIPQKGNLKYLQKFKNNNLMNDPLYVPYNHISGLAPIKESIISQPQFNINQQKKIKNIKKMNSYSQKVNNPIEAPNNPSIMKKSKSQISNKNKSAIKDILHKPV